MPIENWRKWLEEQFLDTNPLEPVEAEADEVEAASSRESEPAAELPSAVVGDEAARPSPYTPPITIERTNVDPIRERPRHVSTEGEDLPQLENYLPFLRAERSDPPAQTAPTTPTAPVTTARSDEPHSTMSRPPEASAAPPSSGEGDAASDAAVHATAQDEDEAPAVLGMAAPSEDRTAPTIGADPEPTPGRATPPVAPTTSMTRKRRGRSARPGAPAELAPPMTGDEFWQLAPRHIRTLLAMGTGDEVQRSYRRQFKESRLALIERLLDPTLSLEETARLLDVCPTTVRRYTNRGQLRHQRTAGSQRRFKLSDVLAFMEAQYPAEDEMGDGG